MSETTELCRQCGEDRYARGGEFNHDEPGGCHRYVPPAPTGEAQPVTQEETKVSRCPFCGSGLIETEDASVQSAGAYMRCMECDAAGPLATAFEFDRIYDGAIQLWNTRTPAPAPEWVGEYRRQLRVTLTQPSHDAYDRGHDDATRRAIELLDRLAPSSPAQTENAEEGKEPR